ncbi:ABC transporter substrate-binding protein [Jeotgalibacillus haloalkalitolerans]|uniref:Extracellular solute-binding protein n=1 Tax=Jeotgalibacillus haloalkalitolerans TaxID=3104292 RepID=A0ABU5KJH2_9BACL|nr:extracellular solute-binding protein [Jeotgalibacillus sp. HH7-29]MDZ5711398.1 extracellular solute-binding protein [Jeotgalibacillus sp. HH7-29]
MKKALLAGSLAVSAILAGCVGGSGGNDTAGSSNGSGDGGETTISFIHWRGEDKAVFDELISQFEEENPDISVDMTIYPSEQYQSTAQTLLRDGSTGDVFTSFPGSQFEIINRAGLFEDLSGEEFVGNYNEQLITAGQSEDGQQLALPLQLVFNQPVYNATLFEELGLDPNPKSWDEFLALCQELLDAGYTPIAFPGSDIGPGQFMNPMMMNNAPEEDIFDQLMAGEAKLTDEWWVKTLSQFQELNDLGYLNQDSLGTNHNGAISLVANEEAAMLATGSYAMAGIKEINPDIDLGLIAPITVAEDEMQWEGINTTTFMLAVNANSEKKEAAKEFVSFLSETEHAETYANETSQHVTVNDVEYESEELSSASEWMDRNTRFQPRYLIPNADVEKAVIASIQSVLGGASPEEAAEEAQQIVDQNIE